MTRIVGGSARSRARLWGRLVKSIITDEGYRELRQKTDGTLTLIVVERDRPDTYPYVTYTTMRPSEAAMATLRW